MGNDWEKEVRTPPRGIEDALFVEMANEMFHAPATRDQNHRGGQSANGVWTQHDVRHSGGIDLRFCPYQEPASDQLKRALAYLAVQGGRKVEEETRGDKQKNDCFSARVCVGLSAGACLVTYVLTHLGH